VNRWFWPGLYLVLMATSLGVVAWTLAAVVDGPLAFAPAASTGVPVPEMVNFLGNNPIVTQPIPVRVDVACDPADLARCATWIAGPVPCAARRPAPHRADKHLGMVGARRAQPQPRDAREASEAGLLAHLARL
jgi:hypothetical protein